MKIKYKSNKREKLLSYLATGNSLRHSICKYPKLQQTIYSLEQSHNISSLHWNPLCGPG